MIAAGRRWFAILAAALLAAAGAACDRDAEDYKPEPNVYCVLRTDKDYALLLAGMTVGYDDTVSGRNWNGTAGVVAAVARGSDEWQFAAIPDSLGFYSASPVNTVPGDTCRLTATYPGGAVVRGTTVVPGRFGIDSATIDTVGDARNPEEYWQLELRYHRGASAGAAGSYASSTVWYRDEGDSWSYTMPLMVTDSLNGTLELQPFWMNYDTLTGEPDTLWLNRLTLRLWAVDRNYNDYLQAGWSGTNTVTHLDGGVGVFGSAVVIETTFVFQPPR